MARKAFQIVAIIAVAALVGTASLTVLATGDDPGVQKGDLLSRLHQLGHRLHGGGHHQDPMARLVEQLELTPDQLRRLEKVLEMTAVHGGGQSGSMAELHDRLVAQLEQGHVETEEIRRAIDGHVEQIRDRAYAVTDEVIALVNGLSATQREIVLAHLKGNHGGHHGHGH